jgi:tripeptide aminopeptidase
MAKHAPSIGFLAHMDTSPDMSGANVNPQFIENYDGGDIWLDKAGQVVLSPLAFPDLKKYTGQTLITTDGATLLGADDKAGIAEIMSVVEYLVQHPEIKHGDICIGFTPDEEVGRGVAHFDVSKFGAEFAYTIDGGEAGEAAYETFNAAHASVTIHGRSVHPGAAKHKMVNAARVAMEFDAMLPVNERPEYTEGYEGFYHLTRIQGNVEEATLEYIIRDHDREKFEAKKAFMERAVAFLNARYDGRLSLEMSDTYYNLREKIEPVIHIVESAQQAIRAAGLTPILAPVRGGTDGSQLSYKGLPTPNLFTGGHNAHGKYEYIPVQSMEKAVEVILKIIEIYAQ